MRKNVAVGALKSVNVKNDTKHTKEEELAEALRRLSNAHNRKGKTMREGKEMECGKL